MITLWLFPYPDLLSPLSSPSACLGSPLMVGRGRWIMVVSSNRRSRCQDPSQVMRDPRARTLGSTQPCYGWTRFKGRLPAWAHRCAITAACRATESTNDWSESWPDYCWRSIRSGQAIKRSNTIWSHTSSFFLTMFCFPTQVETEGRPELQQARKRAAGEVEGLLRYLEGNATHPSRLAIEELTQEAQNLLDEGVVGPFRQGQAQDAFEISEELVEAVQNVAMRLAQVKTGGNVPLRKARYKALTRVCAVQEILEGQVRTHTLALPLSDDTHEAVQRINQVMAQVKKISRESTILHLNQQIIGIYFYMWRLQNRAFFILKVRERVENSHWDVN